MGNIPLQFIIGTRDYLQLSSFIHMYFFLIEYLLRSGSSISAVDIACAEAVLMNRIDTRCLPSWSLYPRITGEARNI